LIWTYVGKHIYYLCNIAWDYIAQKSDIWHVTKLSWPLQNLKTMPGLGLIQFMFTLRYIYSVHYFKIVLFLNYSVDFMYGKTYLIYCWKNNNAQGLYIYHVALSWRLRYRSEELFNKDLAKLLNVLRWWLTFFREWFELRLDLLYRFEVCRSKTLILWFSCCCTSQVLRYNKFNKLNWHC
jgi:hypothetical protein